MKTRVVDKLSLGASVVVIGFAVVALLSLPTMWLWDWLMPEIFGLKEITWMQALGLNALCAILFRTHARRDER